MLKIGERMKIKDMERLTHERKSGMKTGYWSPNKKQELVDRLAMYEDREDAISRRRYRELLRGKYESRNGNV